MSRSSAHRPDAHRPVLPVLRELATCYQAFERFSAAHLRQLGLTPTQFAVVSALGDSPGMTFRELGIETSITKGTLTGVVDRLEKRGIVRRRACPQDGRRTYVELTPAGQKLHARTLPRHVALCRRAIAQLAPADLARMRVQLAALRRGTRDGEIAVTRVDEVRYGDTAIALHWFSVALIAGGFTIGFVMVNLPIAPSTLRWYAVHKWFGITVFLLALVRLLWRWSHPPPPPVAMPEWQRRASRLIHATLYALMIVIPISGYVYSTAAGVQVVYLGILPLPDLVGKDRELAAILRIVHIALDFTLLALVLVHAGAALAHHYLDRDAVLARMLPWRWR